jgi:hypothetical protein
MNKDHAYEWCVHIKLFPRTSNTRESPFRVRALWGILRYRKELVQKLLGRHRAQEQTACFQSETIVGRVPIMYFRGIRITSRSFVRYRSTGRIGRVWGWGDWSVSCRRWVECGWRNTTVASGWWREQVRVNRRWGYRWRSSEEWLTSHARTVRRKNTCRWRQRLWRTRCWYMFTKSLLHKVQRVWKF